MSRWGRPRRSPYTAEGIRRVPCVRCGKPARFQWSICADGNTPRAICAPCDVALNTMVMRWVGHPERGPLIKAYRKKVLG